MTSSCRKHTPRIVRELPKTESEKLADDEFELTIADHAIGALVDLSSVLHLPPKPSSVEATGLESGFIADLVLKTIGSHQLLLGHQIADVLKLPFANVVEKAIEVLRRDRLVEVAGSGGSGAATYQYAATRQGSMRAHELMERDQYVGPAPVTLDAYTRMVQAQSLANQKISQDALKSALSNLVLSADTINQLGPAINAGRSVFLYGHTGNGKTSIGLAIGKLLSGTMWIPYAINVDRQIIKVFDSIRHRVVWNKPEEAGQARKGLLSYLHRQGVEPTPATMNPPQSDRYDERWVLIHRPLIVGGGELTPKEFELLLDPTTKYYEAPQQMKANGGVFLVDDLGRQRVTAREILNRWIVPLEKRVDYLNLTIGTKIEVPFDALIVFATNLDPEDLSDEAFLRRLRYRIHVPNPTWDEFREIFKREALKRGIPYSDEALQYIIAEFYIKPNRKPRGVHPRDILDGLVEFANFANVRPMLSKALIDLACQAYFLQE